MHSSAFGAAARMIFRSLSSAARLSSLKPARYSSMVLAFVLGLGAMAEPVKCPLRARARWRRGRHPPPDGTPSDILEQGAFCHQFSISAFFAGSSDLDALTSSVRMIVSFRASTRLSTSLD